EVKRRSADGSVGSPHARVGNCQASKQKSPLLTQRAFLRLTIGEKSFISRRSAIKTSLQA
ncbi:hypothetical protein ACR6A7_21005, partial [Pantoea sp. RRHST58]|uniref:hypothetical protein n=1 Tax=Pantoea sp. RRHST58 TaxID=3425183 RepID=UPI003DA1059C